MSTIVKMPISNVLLGSDYTGAIMVGSGQVKLNVILDTGSSTLAVVSQDFNPSTDKGVTTTNIAQEVQYGSGSWVGAVVRTPVGIGEGVSLSSANLAVTYQESANMFGNAQGIWGLAYKTLNNAFQMPANTWTHKYKIKRIETGKVCDLIAYFGQLTEAGVVADKFAFYTKRSIINSATANPATDPLNQGFFIVGGGEEEKELYTGAFTHVAVLHDIYYNTVCSACRSATRRRSTRPGSARQFEPLQLDRRQRHQQPHHRPAAVRQGSGGVRRDRCELPNDAEDLCAWVIPGRGPDADQPRRMAGPQVHPARRERVAGDADGPARRLLAVRRGAERLCAGQRLWRWRRAGGMSILGLPLLNAYYTVFDRTLGGGRGMISFAKRA